MIIMDDLLHHSELWISIKAQGMPFLLETEMASLIILAVNTVLSDSDQINLSDILSLQKLAMLMSRSGLSTVRIVTKTRILSTKSVPVAGRHYKLLDFQRDNFRGVGSNDRRVSIHGIPFNNVPSELKEITRWIHSGVSSTRCQIITRVL